MTDIKIEKNVPISEPQRGRNLKYPWPDMKKGDSFFVEGGRAMQQGLNASAYVWCKRHHPTRKFTTRAVDGGVRVWRIK